MPSPEDPIAIFSDVHGNAEALEAVFRDIADLGITRVVNLGDVVGYGPHPETCIDLVEERCIINLCGNHDHAVLHGADGFNPIAAMAVEFTRRQLQPGAAGDPDKIRRWEYLKNLDVILETDHFEAMHASPRDPINEYILPSDPQLDPFKIADIFQAMTRNLVFVGHTHFPGLVIEGEDDFIMLEEIEHTFTIEDDRHIVCNVGSVGQPRDHDTRSCYVVFDGKTIQYRRVQYDVEKVVQQVKQSHGLHEVCGLRLREGR